jgi:chaperonin cofactor prefoldin
MLMGFQCTRMMNKHTTGLVRSLNRTKSNLFAAKKESSDMEFELSNLHKQQSEASKLQAEIENIQQHAKINYETGELEVGLMGEFSNDYLDQVVS